MQDYEMERVKILSEQEYKRIHKDGRMTKNIRESIGIPEGVRYGIGDTFVHTKIPTVARELLSCFYNGRKFYYVVANPVDEVSAFCYSFYPIAK